MTPAVTSSLLTELAVEARSARTRRGENTAVLSSHSMNTSARITCPCIHVESSRCKNEAQKLLVLLRYIVENCRTKVNELRQDLLRFVGLG
jgi:hypothetical protein